MDRMKQVGFAGEESLRLVTESELPTESISGRAIKLCRRACEG